jgi:hypothetical protein
MRKASTYMKSRIALVAAALVGAVALLAGPGAQDANAATYRVTVNLTGTGKGSVSTGGWTCSKPGSAPVACAYSYTFAVPPFKSFWAIA